MIALAAFGLYLVATHSSIFDAAQFWAAIGAALTAIGLLGGWIGKHRLTKTEKVSDTITLYTNFVDDLQVELKRLHELLLEERATSAKQLRDKSLQIERLEMKIISLQQRIEELQHGQ